MFENGVREVHDEEKVGDAVSVQVPDERMSFQEIDLDHVLFLLQEPAQVLEAPGAAVHRNSGGLLDALDGVFFGQAEQALEHAAGHGFLAGCGRLSAQAPGVGAHQLATCSRMWLAPRSITQRLCA